MYVNQTVLYSLKDFYATGDFINMFYITNYSVSKTAIGYTVQSVQTRAKRISVFRITQS